LYSYSMSTHTHTHTVHIYGILTLFLKTPKVDAHEEVEHRDNLTNGTDLDDDVGDAAGGSDDDLDYMENVIVVYRPASLPIPESSAFTAVPCGVCPVFNECAPGGLVSPETCAYMKDWLSF
jgi:hypothetical protein